MLVTDAQMAGGADMLVEMAERKIPAIHGLLIVMRGQAALLWGDGLQAPIDVSGEARGGGEERGGVAQIIRVFHQHHLALVAGAQGFQRFDDIEAQAAGVEFGVGGDAGAGELGGDAAIRQIEHGG